MDAAGQAAKLARDWPRPYAYPSRLKRLAARLLDALGGALMPPASRPLPWNQIRRVAVLRLDHLGDLLNAYPALDALKRAMPSAKLDLFVGPWGKELAAMFKPVDAVRVVQAPWFERPRRVRWPWRAIRQLGRRLRQGEYDLVVELRGDLRHHLAAWFSGAPYRLGIAQTAGIFFLTHRAWFQPGLHEREQNLVALKAHGLAGKVKPAEASLVIPKKARREAASVARSLKLGRGYVAVQAAAGTLAKRWPTEHWAQLLGGIKGRKVVLLGTKGERVEMEALAARCKRRPVIASGRLSLPGLAAFLKRASLVISVDSGPAHLAAAVGTPLLSLYSGTNRVEQWGPRGKQVTVLQRRPPCSPCELSECPLNHECMRELSPRRAAAALKTFKRRKA